jgi:Domain of unknown function (DUF4386)
MSLEARARWAPLAGPVFVALMVLGFIITGDSPAPDDSNSQIASYLGDDSKYDKNIAGFFFVLAATLFLVGFFAALRARLAEAEGERGGLAALAYGAGIASAVLMVVAIFVFISPVFAAHDAGRNVLDPGIYRLTQDLGYMLWVASVVVGALTVWATSALALRTGVLPRWFGWAGVVVGVLCLVAIFFIPIFVFWLWIVVAGVLLVRRPASAVPAAA